VTPIPRAALFLATALGVAVLGLALGQGHGLLPSLAAALTLTLLFLPWLALGFPRYLSTLPRPGRLSPLSGLGLLVVYLLYSAGTGGGSLRGFTILFIYLLSTALAVIVARSSASFWVLVAAVLLWAPFDIRWGERRFLAGIWQWPSDDLSYPLSTLVASVAALVYFQWSRPLGIRYEWRLRREDGFLIPALLLALALMIIPAGWRIGFLAPGLHTGLSAGPLAARLATAVSQATLIFIFTAIPEEILFRGILHNWLQRRLGDRRPVVALILSSVVFGAAHLNNSAGVFGTPNYMYMVFATIAGLAYGIAWMRSGITAAALLHAAVDAIWHFFLAGAT
jgi:hypothetical protein